MKAVRIWIRTVLAVVLVLVVAALCPHPATARPASRPVSRLVPHPARHSRPMRLVPGAAIRREHFSLGSRQPERAYLLHVDLSAGSGLRIDAAAPKEAVGARRRTVGALADRSGAIAGINGDWFDITSWASVPRGALIRSGHVLKTPRPGWNANFYIRPDGTAGIGPIPFRGTVVAHPGKGTTDPRFHHIFAVNSPVDAAHGLLVYVTHDLVALDLRRPCAVATGRTTPDGRVLTGVETRARDIPRVRKGRWALVSCGGRGAAYLRSLYAGEHVAVSLDFPQGRPEAAVSGGRVLLQDGRPFRDSGGQRLIGWNPETFACASRSGRSVILGVVDGRSTASAGVTQPQLSSYLQSLHCWSAMTFDGGGSSTLVARVGRHGRDVSTVNHPSDGRPRPVADGLYVYAAPNR
jgi:hypothetical protein